MEVPWTAQCGERCGRCCWIVTALVVLVVLSVTLAFFPIMPSYAICNSSFEWSSVLKGLVSLRLRGDYGLRVSVYNPNRFGVELQQGHATFLYQGEPVGVWHSDETLTAGGGAVTDFYARCSFTPSLAQATAMRADMQAGKLKLDVTGHLMGVAHFPIFYDYPFQFDFEKHRLPIGPDSDKSLCKCHAEGSNKRE